MSHLQPRQSEELPAPPGAHREQTAHLTSCCLLAMGRPKYHKARGVFWWDAAPRLPATTTRHCRKKLMCRGPPFAEGIVFISLCLPLLHIICPLCAMIPVKTSTLQPRPEPRSAASSKQHPRHTNAPGPGKLLPF